MNTNKNNLFYKVFLFLSHRRHYVRNKKKLINKNSKNDSSTPKSIGAHLYNFYILQTHTHQPTPRARAGAGAKPSPAKLGQARPGQARQRQALPG